MVDNISDAKAKVLERMGHAIGEGGVERMDVEELERLADIYKDLNVAEKECQEAMYYMSVTRAMGGGSGYSSGSYGTQGYMPDVDRQHGSAYDGRSGYRDSMGRYAPRPSGMGYDSVRYGYDMQGLREAMSVASPDEREKMMRELRTMLGM